MTTSVKSRGRLPRLRKGHEKACALDFDDIIMKTVLLLQNNPEVLEYYQRQFRYVLVDEYQVTNYAQYVLTSLLAGYYENICVVGDDDQSIYKFRGATITNILEFENSSRTRNHPSGTELPLDRQAFWNTRKTRLSATTSAARARSCGPTTVTVRKSVCIARTARRGEAAYIADTIPRGRWSRAGNGRFRRSVPQ